MGVGIRGTGIGVRGDGWEPDQTLRDGKDGSATDAIRPGQHPAADQTSPPTVGRIRYRKDKSGSVGRAAVKSHAGSRAGKSKLRVVAHTSRFYPQAHAQAPHLLLQLLSQNRQIRAGDGWPGVHHQVTTSRCGGRQAPQQLARAAADAVAHHRRAQLARGRNSHPPPGALVGPSEHGEVARSRTHTVIVGGAEIGAPQQAPPLRPAGGACFRRRLRPLPLPGVAVPAGTQGWGGHKRSSRGNRQRRQRAYALSPGGERARRGRSWWPCG